MPGTAIGATLATFLLGYQAIQLRWFQELLERDRSDRELDRPTDRGLAAWAAWTGVVALAIVALFAAGLFVVYGTFEPVVLLSAVVLTSWVAIVVVAYRRGRGTR